MSQTETILTEENYGHMALVFRDRQAGVAPIYDPFKETYTYNAYCLEKRLLKELWTKEFDYLVDALEAVNDEFDTWTLESLEEGKSGCGNCAAKK